MKNKFKAGQKVRVVLEVNEGYTPALSENFVAIGDMGVVRSFRESDSGFNIAVQFLGKNTSLYFKAEELEEVEVDECTATGGTCQFVSLSLPSVYMTGVEDGEPRDVIQCKYCGREISDE